MSEIFDNHQMPGAKFTNVNLAKAVFFNRTTVELKRHWTGQASRHMP